MPATMVRVSLPMSTVSFRRRSALGTRSACSTLAVRSSTRVKSSMVISAGPAAWAGAAAGVAGDGAPADGGMERFRRAGHDRRQKDRDETQPLRDGIEDVVQAARQRRVALELPRLVLHDVAVERPDEIGDALQPGLEPVRFEPVDEALEGGAGGVFHPGLAAGVAG